MSKHHVYAALVVFLFLAGSGTLSAHPTVTGETGLFEILSSETLDKGDFSFGFYLNNWDRELGDDHDAMDLDITTASASFFYSLVSRLEVGIQVNFIDLYSKEEGESGDYNGDSFSSKIDESGFGDVRLGAKYTVLSATEKAVGLGVAAFAKLPTADDEKGLGTGQTDFGFKVALTKPFEALSFHANVGYTVMGEPDDVEEWDNVINYGIGVNFPNNADDAHFVQFIGELTGANDPNPDLPSYLDLTLGSRIFFTKVFHEGQQPYRNGWALSLGIRYNLLMEAEDCPIGGILGLSFVPPYVPPPPPPPPQPPTIIGVEGLPASMKACEMTEMRVNAQDPDDDIVEYRWTATCGTIVGSGPVVKWEAPCPCTPNTPKTCSVTVTVVDSKGQSTMSSQNVAVICPPPPKPPEQPPSFENAFFGPGSARVDNIAKAVLDEIAMQMKEDTRLYVIIQGHSDNRGSEESNMKMGLKRANNVKDYLVKEHNIDPNRLETLSFGSSRPIGDNSTRDGRAQNRRVDFVVEIR